MLMSYRIFNEQDQQKASYIHCHHNNKKNNKDLSACSTINTDINPIDSIPKAFRK